MIFMDGECPQCALTGATIRLQLNKHDLMECESCHLQTSLASPGTATIMGDRGRGMFRVDTLAPPIPMVGLALSGQAPPYPVSDGPLFR